jgi:catechol 2,3-dioxygenase-like lactoylglutathione lyase family enzyme
MSNSFSRDILIQAPDPNSAAAFYVDNLGFEVTGEEPNMISLHGKHVTLFIEQGPLLGPVLEVTVDSVEAAKRRLLARGCTVVKDEPDFPRCYIRDIYGLTYNLTSHAHE